MTPPRRKQKEEKVFFREATDEIPKKRVIPKMGTLFWIKGLILKIFSSLFLRKGTMAAEFSSHSFQNRLPDYDASTTGVPFDSLVFRKYIEELVKSTLDEYPSSKDKEKPTIYTGLGGVSLMFLEIHRYNQQCVEQEKENEKISLPKKKVPLFYARYFLDLAKKKVERMGWTPSFICGAPGLAALEIAIQVEENTFQSSGSTEHLLSLADYCKRRQEKVVCNEHLYGRSGYLFSLLYAQSASKVDLSSSATASSVLSLIFEDGLDGAKQFQKENKRNIMEEWGGEDRSPLLFSWHDKYYLGAAHGMSGIMFTLLDFPLSEHQMDLVKDSIVYMLNHCRFASGNYCSKMYQSKEAKYDRLVQWCHGATGFVILFCKAFRVFGEDRFYQAAERAGEVERRISLLFFYFFIFFFHFFFLNFLIYFNFLLFPGCLTLTTTHFIFFHFFFQGNLEARIA